MLESMLTVADEQYVIEPFLLIWGSQKKTRGLIRLPLIFDLGDGFLDNI